MKIALVSMPWVDVEIPLLGMASLKSFLEAQGHRVDCLHLNLLMLSRVGPLAAALARDMTWSEWPFAYHLFGPGGAGELTEEPADLIEEASFRAFLAETGLRLPRWETLVRQDVPRFLEDCLSQTDWSGYDLIGFSSVFGSHTACLTMSRELKRRLPGTPIVFGGANVEGEMGLSTLKGCEWIDYVVDGEGELALAALARGIGRGERFEPVPRVSFRRAGEVVPCPSQAATTVALGSLPAPDHRDFFDALDRYGVAGRVDAVPTFEASRGCWWGQKQHCTFCSFNGSAMAFRAKSVEQVLREITTLCRRHRTTRLRAADNIIGLDHLRRLAPELARLRRELGLEWELFFEVKSNLTSAQIESLAEAGITSIQPGIESLSTPILRLMRKGVSAIQNIQTLKLGAQNGLEILWNILWGFPGEDPADYERMAELVPSLSHLPPPVFCGPVRVERFSPFYFDWPAFDSAKPVPQDFYRHVYPAPRFDPSEIAYRFDFAGKTDSVRYAQGLEQAVRSWKRSWPKSLLAYRQGPGFVRIYDSRPRQPAQEPALRASTLEGLEAAAFSACGAITGVEELLPVLRRSGHGWDRARLRDALDGLVERRWLHREGSAYLSLAVPASRLPPRQKLLLEEREALAA